MKITESRDKIITVEMNRNEFRTILHCIGECSGRCESSPKLQRAGTTALDVRALADHIQDCPAVDEKRLVALSTAELDLAINCVAATDERLDDSDLWYVVAARRAEVQRILAELRGVQGRPAQS